MIERIDDRWKEMLPYRMLDLYEGVAMAAEDSEDGAATARCCATRSSRPSRSPRVCGTLASARQCLPARVAPEGAAGDELPALPKERFRVDVERNDTLRRYLEMAPDVELVADDGLMAGGGRAPATLRLDA